MKTGTCPAGMKTVTLAAHSIISVVTEMKAMRTQTSALAPLAQLNATLILQRPQPQKPRNTLGRQKRRDIVITTLPVPAHKLEPLKCACSELRM